MFYVPWMACDQEYNGIVYIFVDPLDSNYYTTMTAGQYNSEYNNIWFVDTGPRFNNDNNISLMQGRSCLDAA